MHVENLLKWPGIYNILTSLFFKYKTYSPQNYRWQNAIAFNITIKEKIINSKFLPLIIYLQFTMNLSLFYWIRSLLFYTHIYSFKKTFLSWLFYLKSKFSIHFRLQHITMEQAIMLIFSIDTKLKAWCPDCCQYRFLLCPMQDSKILMLIIYFIFF